MDKKLIGAITGASAIALLAGGAAASTPSAPPSGVQAASSFAELLDPVPDAISVLKADDQRARETDANGVQLAQYDEEGFGGYGYRHHHHHHHHHFRRFEDGPRGYGFGFRHFERRYHHHHHHHHFRRYYGD